MFVLIVGSCFETTPVYPLLTSASNVQLYIGVDQKSQLHAPADNHHV